MILTRGDKVVCISKTINNPNGYRFIYTLTIGKQYTIQDIYSRPVYMGYMVSDDNNKNVYYDERLFISLKEYRKNVINEILDI